MLRMYRKEFEKDWDDGTPLLLFAATEVTQESLGFSPALKAMKFILARVQPGHPAHSWQR